MGADFAAFFDDADRKLRVELLEPDGGGEAAGAGADHQDVELHRLARFQFCRHFVLHILVAV